MRDGRLDGDGMNNARFYAAVAPTRGQACAGLIRIPRVCFATPALPGIMMLLFHYRTPLFVSYYLTLQKVGFVCSFSNQVHLY
jgi:hypothetical protein